MKSFVEIFLSYFSVSRSRIFRFRFVIFSWLYKFIFVANHIVRTITVNYRIQVTQWQNWRWLVSLMRALQSNAIHYDNLFLRNCVDVHSTQPVWVFHSKCICNLDQLCASNIVFLMKIYKTGKNMKICVLCFARLWIGQYDMECTEHYTDSYHLHDDGTVDDLWPKKNYCELLRGSYITIKTHYQTYEFSLFSPEIRYFKFRLAPKK